jgi:hypothetical protein
VQPHSVEKTGHIIANGTIVVTSVLLRGISSIAHGISRDVNHCFTAWPFQVIEITASTFEPTGPGYHTTAVCRPIACNQIEINSEFDFSQVRTALAIDEQPERRVWLEIVCSGNNGIGGTIAVTPEQSNAIRCHQISAIQPAFAELGFKVVSWKQQVRSTFQSPAPQRNSIRSNEGFCQSNTQIVN